MQGRTLGNRAGIYDSWVLKEHQGRGQRGLRKHGWCDGEFTRGTFQGGGGEWVAQCPTKIQEKRPSAVSENTLGEESRKLLVVRKRWRSVVVRFSLIFRSKFCQPEGVHEARWLCQFN